MESDVYATKIIRPLTQANIRIFLDILYEKVAKSIPFEEYNGADVYKFGDDETGYVVLVDGKEIIYFVRHRRISHNQFRLGRQVLLWRKSSAIAAFGFAFHVFFDILLPRYGSLIADKEQTEDGRRFWANAIAHAFRTNRYIYFLDRRRNPNKLTRLHDRHELRTVESDIWGDSPQHIYTFAVISNKKLKLKDKESK